MADVDYNFITGSWTFLKTGTTTTPTTALASAKIVSNVKTGFVLGDGQDANAGTFATTPGRGYRVTVDEVTLLNSTQLANLETALGSDVV